MALKDLHLTHFCKSKKEHTGFNAGELHTLSLYHVHAHILFISGANPINYFTSFTSPNFTSLFLMWIVLPSECVAE